MVKSAEEVKQVVLSDLTVCVVVMAWAIYVSKMFIKM